MTDREKLINLIMQRFDWQIAPETEYKIIINANLGELVDALLAHGVTVRETTSEDFLAKVKDLERKHYPDFETMHSVLDLAMEELLIELGYEAAVDFIREQDRWYS